MNTKTSKVSKALKYSTVFFLLFFALLVGTSAKAAPYTPAKVTGLVQTEAKSSSVSFQWTQVLGSDIQYYVETSNDGVNWIPSTSSILKTDSFKSNLTAGTGFYIRVRADNHFWDNDKGSYVDMYGEYSDALYVVTSPAKTEAVTQIDGTFNSITLQWAPVPGASYYQICNHVGYQQDVLITTTTDTTAVIGNLPLNTKMSFTIKPVAQSPTFTAPADYGTTISDCVTVADSTTDLLTNHTWFGTGTVRFQWTGNETATNYELALYKAKGNKYIGTYTSPYHYTDINNIKENTFYKVRIRPITTINNQPKYGNWSPFLIFSSQPSKLEAKTTKNAIKASWSKVNGATNYTVYVSTRQKTAYKKVATVKGTRLTIKKYGKQKLKSKKGYYFTVKANLKAGNETYSSEMSYCLYSKTK